MSWDYHLDRMRGLDEEGRREYIRAQMSVPILAEDGTEVGRFAALSSDDARELLVRARAAAAARP